MKICAIGDPHGDLSKVRKIPLRGVDLILLTGDLGSANLARKIAFSNIERRKKGLPEIEYTSKQRKEAFMQSYNSSLNVVNYLRRFCPVFLIFGNVESTNKETDEYANKLGTRLPHLYDELRGLRNVRVINNRVANFSGVRIGGLKYFIDVSWVRDFRPQDYRSALREASKETRRANGVLKWFDEVDILLCHQPPYGVLDKVTASFAPKNWKGKHAGSKAILEYVEKKSPRYVFCGHIHEGEGVKKIRGSEIHNLGVAGYKIIEIDR